MTLSLTTSQVGGFSAPFKCRSTVEIKALLAEHAELVPPNVSQTVLLQQLEYGKPRPTSSFNTKAKAYWAVFKTLDSGNIVEESRCWDKRFFEEDKRQMKFSTRMIDDVQIETT